ncbi:putative cytochrome-b5 reductase [Helianthus annuus]|nr:putative cytochrome-b5 reductase [Helianthus annuus]KAJ0676974.1 putative cytochrome-b5 reductase [Helianthus annuus]
MGFSTYRFIWIKSTRTQAPKPVGFCCIFLISSKTADYHPTTLIPDKWVEFKLQEKAKVSHNTHLYRAPLGEDAEGKTKFVVRP